MRKRNNERGKQMPKNFDDDTSDMAEVSQMARFADVEELNAEFGPDRVVGIAVEIDFEQALLMATYQDTVDRIDTKLDQDERLANRALFGAAFRQGLRLGRVLERGEL